MVNTNKHLLPELSIFFPCYNEENNIVKTVDKALPIVKKITSKWEIILINDGSKDNTLGTIEAIRSKLGKNIKIINHPQNRGYGAALKSGLYGAKYKWITFTDSDGQFDFKDIYQLIKKQKQTKADLTIGYYLGRKVPFYRKWGSYAWQLAVFSLFGLSVKDIDCGFKLIKKEVIDNIDKLEAERGPFITSELLIKAKQKGYKIVETGVHHFARLEGEATGSKLNVILSAFKDLLNLKVKLLTAKS